MTKKSSIQNTSKKPYNNVVKLCAAGSGKTYGICQDSLSLVTSSAQRKRILMITFTNNGVATINKYIANQNQGLPSNKVVDSFPKNPLFQQINLKVGSESIEAMCFIGGKKA